MNIKNKITVEQFISELQQFPKDAKVVIPSLDRHGYDTAFSPSPRYYENYNRVYL